MWCPSVSLSVWVNAWLAGAAAPDDVLDALSRWAPRHSVTAYDAAAATRTGLPWPDLTDAGAVSLLQTLRTASGSQRGEPAVALALPVPGDVRGLPAGTQFQRDAVAVGEAVLVYGDPAGPVGLVPDFDTDGESDSDEFDPGFEFEAGFGAGLDGAGAPDRDPGPHTLCWTVYSAPPAPRPRHRDLGEAEFELRSAVRAAADALGTLRAGATGSDVGDPRGMVERILESARGHGAPEHSPERALRVLENAAHVDAIITVSSGLMPIGLQSSSEIRIANDALRPLSVVVRSARLAAVDAILGSAWRSR